MPTWTLHKPLDLSSFDLWTGDDDAQPSVTTSSQYRLNSGSHSLSLSGRGFFYDDDDDLLPFGDIFRIDLFDSLEAALQVLDIVWDLLHMLSYYNPFTDHWDLEGLRDYLFEEVDWFDGSEGDDVLAGFGGDDVLDGDGGIDTAHYRGARADYRLAREDDSWSVADRPGRDGTDSLSGIERLQFDDTAVALDLDGHAGTVARLVGSLFGPAHVGRLDLMGVGLSLLDAGMGAEDLAALALRSGYFAELAGSHSDADFVRQVYRNVTGQEAGAAEVAYYAGLIADGTHTQASLALWASETAALAQRIDLVGLAGTGVAYDANSG
jgi:hypothetical protein